METTTKPTGQEISCPYCGKPARFMTSQEFYGKDYGTNLYSCQPCDARIGTHERTAKPLGTLAKPELRKLRMEAHKLFDPLWKPNYKGNGKRRMSRKQAYSWLTDTMGIERDDAHIGMFNEAQCRRLISVLKIVKGD